MTDHLSHGGVPIRAALRFPSRIGVERIAGLQTFTDDEIRLHFDGSDGSRLTVVLSQEQANALVGMAVTDPAKMARDLYVAGHIDVAEFERRLEAT